MAQEQLLSIQEVTQILEIPESMVQHWIKKGILHPVSAEGVWHFYPQDIRDLFEERQAGAGARKNRILIIDDDPLVGESLRKLLEKTRYEARVASVGLAALDLVSRESFDLILTDIRMPGMDGIETLKAIRALRNSAGKPPLPEIVITAYFDEKIRKEAGALGVRGFILKPFEITELLSALEKILNTSRGEIARAF